MKYAALIESLKKYGTLTDNSIRLLKERGEARTIAVKDHLLIPGEVCKNLYFINKGLFRRYRFVNKKDRTVGFNGLAEHMTSADSFFNQVLSKEGIVCESKAEIICLNYFAWQSMCNEDPDFNKICCNITLHKLIESIEHLSVFNSSKTKEKVIYLCKLYPGILNVVTQKSIASLFHLTPQAMNRVIPKL